MSIDFLSEAKDCVTLRQAAQRLSKLVGQELDEADLLARALNGHFKLSVFLPPTIADCWESPEEIDEGNPQDYWADRGQNPVNVRVEDIRGIWDVPMVPPGELEMRRVYDELRGHSSSAPSTLGTVVQKSGKCCRLRTATATSSVTSAASPENQFVIRTERFDAYIATLSALHSPSSIQDKKVSTKERESFFIIIAALARAAQIDIFKPSKAAETIQTLASTELSQEISLRNIEEKLKDVVTFLHLKDE